MISSENQLINLKNNKMNTTGSSVLLALPKYVTITPNSSLAKIRPAPALSPASTSSGYDSSTHSNAMEEESEPIQAPKGKKRRLDHLTWEEKIQRKKLKNRVAAQTSRDRKKARMEEMETEIKTLTQTTELLQNKCESLQAINDSLLEKNQKLDMELELMRQQLTELQQQQQQKSSADIRSNTTAAAGFCAGCASNNLIGSAAGINPNGHTVDTRTAIAKEQHDGGTLEDCCALPALQDMLLLDEEFDASKLEELAESLLADISADMEASDRKGNETAAEATGGTERLPRSMVGTAAKRLESSQHSKPTATTTTPTTTSSAAASSSLISSQTKTQPNEFQKEFKQIENDAKIDITQMLKNEARTKTNHTASNICSSNYLVDSKPKAVDVDSYETVYGTYDAKTNSITIVMDNDAVPVNEAVEEIYCDDVAPPPPRANQIDDHLYMKCESPVASPSQVFLNVNYASDEEAEEPVDNHDEIVDVGVDDDIEFDPIAKFLRPNRPIISPLAKSPAPSMYSATSDHGYESIIGSPEVPSRNTTAHIDSVDVDNDFAWNSSFNELFPTLI